MKKNALFFVVTALSIVILLVLPSPLFADQWKSVFDDAAEEPTTAKPPPSGEYSVITSPEKTAEEFEKTQTIFGDEGPDETSARDCIPLLRADPETMPADGQSVSDIHFKIVCPGGLSYRLNPNAGTLTFPPSIVEDMAMKASYKAPSLGQLGSARQVLITFIPEEGAEKSVTIKFTGTAQAECPDPESEYRALKGFVDGVAKIEKDAKLVQAMLSVQRFALKKIPFRIAENRDMIRVVQIHKHRMRGYHKTIIDRSQKRISKLEKQRREILNAQDEAIDKTMGDFKRALRDLDGLLASSQCPDVLKALEKMKAAIEKRKELCLLDMYLAAGKRDEFLRLLTKYVSQGKYTEYITYYKALDHLENGKRSDALYTLRKALEEHPDNELIAAKLKSVEVGYLRAIDAKVQGEAAKVRAMAWARFKEFGEQGWWSYLKDVFDMGVITSTRALIGDFDKLEQLQSIQLDEAAVAHGGLLILTRLREKGLEFSEIRGLDNANFIKTIEKLFGQRIEPEKAMKMRFAITQAFQNPDVNRLFKQSREAFDVDLGRSYFATEDFQKTWLEHIYDAVDGKNLAMFLGPNAVLSRSVGGTIFTRNISAAELMSATTFRDAFSQAVGMKKLLDILSGKSWGAPCAEYLCKFEAEAGMAKQLIAEGLVQSGIVLSAAAIPGQTGKAAMAAAEILTMLAGFGDLNQTVRILKKCGVGAKDVGNVARNVVKMADQAANVHISSTHLRLLEDALSKLESGSPIPPELKASLKEHGEQFLKKLKENADSVGKNPLQQRAVANGRMYHEAGEQVLEGNAGKAKTLKSSADQTGEGIADDAQQLRDRADKLDDVEKKLKQSGDDVEDAAKKKDATPGLDSNSEKRKLPPEDAKKEADKVFRLFQVPTTPPKEASDLVREANEAMRNGDFRKASELYRDARRIMEGVQTGDATEVAKAQAKKAAADVAEKEKLAVRTEQESGRILKPGSARDEAAGAAIGSSESHKVENAVDKAFKEADDVAKRKAAETAAQSGGNPDELYKRFYQEELDSRMPRMLTSSGAESTFDPRVVEVDGEKYIFKAASDQLDGNDVRAETVASKVAEKLGMDSPGASGIRFSEGGRTGDAIVTRFVKDSHDLTVARPETLVAVKNHVAEDRVMSLLIGDSDRHAGQILVGKNRVYSIDHGLGELIEREVDFSSVTSEQLREKVLYQTWVRYDWIKKRQKGGWHPAAKAIETQITPKDYNRMLKKVESLSEKDVKNMLKGAYPEGSAEMENAVKTLMMRKECIRDVLEGRYQYTPPGRGALEKTDGNKEISFLRNETGGFPLKRAA